MRCLDWLENHPRSLRSSAKFFFICVFSFYFSHSFAQSQLNNQKRTSDPAGLTQIKSGLGIIWAMDFINADYLVFTERNGAAGVLNINNGQVDWLDNLPQVYGYGQGGLLDVKTAPDFAQSRWLYFTYAKPFADNARTTLARARLEFVDERFRLADWQDLLISDSLTDSDIHFGSRIAFDGDGHVFFSIGDRGQRANAQNLQNHAGKVLRLTMDGRVPTDNPFAGLNNVKPEIWSYGHRNPQGLFFDSRRVRLWEMEHGPRGGDEINLIVKGGNYGWPVVSQGREYFSGAPVGEPHKAGMIEPVKVYIPSIAPSDLLVYQGERFVQWRGSLFSGALKLQHLNQVVLDEQLRPLLEKRHFESLKQRIRAIAEDDSGRLYIATDNGNIYQWSND
ncbi:PQQ-dependent sugar dehydrogenase [Thiomicrorhabdus sediminis]|uniref:PQQ-dependent sugar dehydrogenase n=1 Tax=Thiomicrorhabdus sediminis TaxID=2580412 RepID=A0A4P9K5I5_9GAMM|nr:PQQ-dependent sugar dehydrogenase [Thiomicrorhabdus sediminis]QCU90061.1 PQQ-dependent sugar dehydrogenase [Thiomicrorhabdus sediminis]